MARQKGNSQEINCPNLISMESLVFSDIVQAPYNKPITAKRISGETEIQRSKLIVFFFQGVERRTCAPGTIRQLGPARGDKLRQR